MLAAIATPHQSASETGRDVLAAGGSAVDAAFAANAMLWACYPHMCGVGGDLFLLYYEAARGTVHCLNGTGRAPALATPEAFLARGLTDVPTRGPLAVTVPGALDAWDRALPTVRSLVTSVPARARCKRSLDWDRRHTTPSPLDRDQRG